MLALRITPAMVRDAFSKTNFINSNGYISDYRRMYLTITDAGIYNKSEIENTNFCAYKKSIYCALSFPLIKEINIKKINR